MAWADLHFVRRTAFRVIDHAWKAWLWPAPQSGAQAAAAQMVSSLGTTKTYKTAKACDLLFFAVFEVFDVLVDHFRSHPSGRVHFREWSRFHARRLLFSFVGTHRQLRIAVPLGPIAAVSIVRLETVRKQCLADAVQDRVDPGESAWTLAGLDSRGPRGKRRV